MSDLRESSLVFLQLDKLNFNFYTISVILLFSGDVIGEFVALPKHTSYTFAKDVKQHKQRTTKKQPNNRTNRNSQAKLFNECWDTLKTKKRLKTAQVGILAQKIHRKLLIIVLIKIKC